MHFMWFEVSVSGDMLLMSDSRHEISNNLEEPNKTIRYPSENGVMKKIKYKSLDALRNIEEVEAIWKQMLAKCPSSFFLSWEWISAWLETLPKELEMNLIIGYLDDEIAVSYFLGKRKITRNYLFQYRIASLNSTGDEYLDELTIEYNGALIAPGVDINVIRDMCTEFSGDWDELIVPGVTGKLYKEIEKLKEKRDNSLREIDIDYCNSYYVGLDKVREVGLDYFKLLSANRRQQIRRSLKEYRKGGEIQVEVAGSTDEAMSMLDALAELHQQEWRKRGKEGSFSNEYFYRFHRSLIKKSFSSNIIQLMHIFNDDGTIGYLYNFLYGNNVLFYQCGFDYIDNNHARPGLIAHYLAVLMNAELGYDTYDFLAGDSQYKKSLATSANTMMWVTLQRKSMRSWIEDRTRNVYRKMKRMKWAHAE